MKYINLLIFVFIRLKRVGTLLSIEILICDQFRKKYAIHTANNLVHIKHHQLNKNSIVIYKKGLQ